MKYTIEKGEKGYFVYDMLAGFPAKAYAHTLLDEALGTLRELFEPEEQVETVYPRVLLFNEDMKPVGSRPMSKSEMEEYARSPKHFRFATTDSPNQGGKHVQE